MEAELSRSWPKPLPLGGELLGIDAARFFAAIGIVLFHYGHALSGRVAVLTTFFRPLELCVDFFFVISGFIISHVYASRLTSRAQYLVFLRRRVARLAPLHWLTLVFFVAVGFAYHAGLVRSEDPSNYDWRCLPYNALALHALGGCSGLSFNFVSWSVSAEMAMYVVAPFAILLCAKSTTAAAGLIAAVWIGLNLYDGDLQPHLGPSWYSWTTHFGVLRAFPEFLLGVLLCKHRGVLAALPGRRTALRLSLAVLVALVLTRMPESVIALAVYGIAALVIACEGRQPYSGHAVRLFGAAGQLSYGVYMLHPVILTLVLTGLGHRVLHLSGTAENLWVALAIALTLLAAAISLRYFETPMRALINGSAGEGRPRATSRPVPYRGGFTFVRRSA